MGTVVYQQGFQSQLNEPRALRLRLSSPNPHFSQPFGFALKSHSLDSSNAEDTKNRSDDKSPPLSTGWSFLQSLSSGSSSSSSKTSPEEDKVYVPRSSSCTTLSNESLALCTENLGSETGSDVTDEDLFSLSPSAVHSKNLEEATTETRRLVKSRKGNVRPSDLPPPLTTMRGFQCIQMKPHREDGRLVMTATKAPPSNRCFQADRSNGRLRLSILKDSDEFVENHEDTIEPEQTEDEYEEEEEDEEEEEEEVLGMENVQRSRRCIEDDRENRGLLNWESFCVATS